ELSKQEIDTLRKEAKLVLVIDDNEINILNEDLEIISTEIEGWLVESEEGVTVGIDTELTEDLIAEGYSREFVNRIQNMRKDAGFDVVDKIKISYNTDVKLSEYINKFAEYISTETLAEGMNSEMNIEKGFIQDFEVGSFNCKISIEKVNNK
ncbi:MAG: isoleucine--tRNA ligase, partial [Ignavibacteria bacterium]|nr:isoleucine--tRNA ligase [Ignavibacteria bacterium]